MSIQMLQKVEKFQYGLLVLLTQCILIQLKVGQAVFHQSFESLLTGTSDEIGSAYGLVAKSMEYPKDRSWVIFNMRPEAKFSDNTPLTAEDVMFSYKLLQEKGLPSFRAVIERD